MDSVFFLLNFSTMIVRFADSMENVKSTSVLIVQFKCYILAIEKFKLKKKTKWQYSLYIHLNPTYE